MDELREIESAWRAAKVASETARGHAYDSPQQDAVDTAWDAYYALCNEAERCGTCWAKFTDCQCI